MNAEEVNEYAQKRLADALLGDKDAVVGKTYTETLPPFEFGRVQTQMARAGGHQQGSRGGARTSV